MKYFTPELFIKGNSPDDDVVDQAEAEWERASARYRRHYRKIARHLPESLRAFNDQCCLHDADVFGPARLSVHTLPWGFLDVVIVAQNTNTLVPEHLNTLMFLQYGVTAEPSVDVPVSSEVFYPGRTIWLYDEIDLIKPGIFSHEILFSDGRVVKLCFREFRFQIAPMVPALATVKDTRKAKAASA